MAREVEVLLSLRLFAEKCSPRCFPRREARPIHGLDRSELTQAAKRTPFKASEPSLKTAVSLSLARSALLELSRRNVTTQPPALR